MNPVRNDPCPCGSGEKYKHCCGRVAAAAGSTSQLLDSRKVGALVAMIEEGRSNEAEHQTRALLRSYPDGGILWKILSVALVRQGKDALQALRRTTELLPHDAEAHRNLGAALHDRRQWDEALVSLRRALEIQPDNVQALVDAANATRALGQARESLALYQRALHINPNSAEAHNNLGNAFLELGQSVDAVACYRRALEISPDNAEIHCNMASALRQLGQLPEALICSQRAIALDPRSSVAHNSLGLALAALGQREPALASYRQALLLNPGYVEALNNLGNILLDLGQGREAVPLYGQAIELDPGRADSHLNLGNVLLEVRRIDGAAASYRRALALRPQYSLAHLGLAAALRMQGRAEEAEASCQAALAVDPNCVEALTLLGELRADRGKFTQSQELFTRAVAIDPTFPSAFCSIAAHARMTHDDAAWLQGVETLLAKALPLRHEISLRYALGKYSDDLGQYDEAFSHYRRANELSKRFGSGYDRAKLTQHVDRIISDFDAAFVSQCQDGASASELPVFVIGMPRSGTSLTEQILASHPAVFGAGEVRFWDSAFDALEAAGPNRGNRAGLVAGMARDYLERLTAPSAGALRVIDKMPGNFLHVGLIHAVFPRARIIHMRRHPIDTCLSIYFQYFSPLHPYANDLDDLAHFYGEYVRLADHWRAALPATTLLEIPYEELIEGQEVWTRRMLDFIGLPWDPKCLDFHQTDRVVITSSKWQVRQKIHSASTGRWRNYENFIGPLQRLMAS